MVLIIHAVDFFYRQVLQKLVQTQKHLLLPYSVLQLKKLRAASTSTYFTVIGQASGCYFHHWQETEENEWIVSDCLVKLSYAEKYHRHRFNLLHWLLSLLKADPTELCSFKNLDICCFADVMTLEWLGRPLTSVKNFPEESRALVDHDWAFFRSLRSNFESLNSALAKNVMILSPLGLLSLKSFTDLLAVLAKKCLTNLKVLVKAGPDTTNSSSYCN